MAQRCFPLIPCYRAWVRPSEISYHFPIILEWKGGREKVPCPFRFNHTWLLVDDFDEFIRYTWDSIFKPNPIYTLLMKLKVLRSTVITWEKNKKFELKCALVEIEEQILDLLLSTSTRVVSADETVLLTELKKRKDEILSIEVASIRLKSRAIWIALGDANSKFFHHYASA